MKKKILTSLLIASIAITGLFAYSTPKAILDATKADTVYTFAIQYNGGALGEEATATETLVLSTDEVTTENDFTVVTTNVGNLGNPITFKAIITTGEFVGNGGNADANTTLYPRIVENSVGILTSIDGEPLSYTNTGTTSFTASNDGYFTRVILAGRHEINTEIARFKLNYQGNDIITAGAYRSTSTVDITVI